MSLHKYIETTKGIMIIYNKVLFNSNDTDVKLASKKSLKINAKINSYIKILLFQWILIIKIYGNINS